jgi:hypothetical protein
VVITARPNLRPISKKICQKERNRKERVGGNYHKRRKGNDWKRLSWHLLSGPSEKRITG